MSSSRRRIAAYTLVSTLAFETAMALGRFQRRKRVFEAATARSVKTGRKLVVVGDPNAGLHTRLVPAYGCGDVCVDLQGCPVCPESVIADITKGVKGIEDDSSIVFCCCVLEYVADIEPAMAELKRIAGADENLFLVFVDARSLTAYLYPGGKRIAADERGRSWNEVTLWKRVVVGGALAGLAVAAIKR